MDTSQSMIKIKPAKGLWMAKHTGPHTEEIVSLFGSDVLPTAFASDTPRDVVIAALRKRNPGFAVL